MNNTRGSYPSWKRAKDRSLFISLIILEGHDCTLSTSKGIVLLCMIHGHLSFFFFSFLFFSLGQRTTVNTNTVNTNTVNTNARRGSHSCYSFITSQFFCLIFINFFSAIFITFHFDPSGWRRSMVTDVHMVTISSRHTTRTAFYKGIVTWGCFDIVQRGWTTFCEKKTTSLRTRNQVVTYIFFPSHLEPVSDCTSALLPEQKQAWFKVYS